MVNKNMKIATKKMKKAFFPLLEDHPAIKIIIDAFDSVLKAKTIPEFLAATQKMFSANNYYYEHIRRKYSDRDDIDTRLSVNFATHYNGVKDVVTKKWLLNPNTPDSVVEFWTEFFKEHGDFDEIVNQRVNEPERIKKEKEFYTIGKYVREYLIKARVPNSIIEKIIPSVLFSEQFPKKLSRYLYQDISEDETTQTVLDLTKQAKVSPQVPPSVVSINLAILVSYIVQQTKPNLIEEFSEEITHLIRSGISYFMKFFYLGLLGKSFTRDVLESHQKKNFIIKKINR